MSDTVTTAKRATILVVDDSPQNLSLMSGLLEDLYNVKLAPGGARALKIAATNPLDLILLDIMMPEIDGYEVCHALKENPATKDIPVMFLTAMDGMADEEKGLLAGAVDYITKPISPPILLARVRNQLALKEAADRLREQNQILEEEKVRTRELLLKLKSASDKLLEQNRLIKQEKDRAGELQNALVTTFQGKSLLDIAWEKLRQLPLNDLLMEDLYKLALEFERKSEIDTMEAVFRHMAGFNRQFRDLEARLAQAEARLNQTMAFGGSPRPVAGTAAFVANSSGKLTLGRYEVEKELGKGAMGTVYLGTNPKIGRVVAIKTMVLPQNTGASGASDIKEHFFREAESAGRLNHPNIVAIYDVGEESNLAYIAMEFLKGGDLVPFTQPDTLLPIDTVLAIAERVAEALNYAHANGVVHRDVKPGNIVYEPETDVVKVTDFGIASIASSAAADAGEVLGTPSYMSPEQVAGGLVDGRSDLYSLGVMLYQLASGTLPFRGESLPNLLSNIANLAPVDIRTYNPDLPDCLVTLINKTLSKDPRQRYQNGEQMAKALNVCRRSFMVFAN